MKACQGTIFCYILKTYLPIRCLNVVFIIKMNCKYYIFKTNQTPEATFWNFLDGNGHSVCLCKITSMSSQITGILWLPSQIPDNLWWPQKFSVLQVGICTLYSSSMFMKNAKLFAKTILITSKKGLEMQCLQVKLDWCACAIEFWMFTCCCIFYAYNSTTFPFLYLQSTFNKIAKFTFRTADEVKVRLN